MFIFFFFLSRMWLPSIYWELPVLIRYYLQSPVTKQLLTTPITSQAVPRAGLFLSLLVFKFLPLQYSVYLQTAASSPTDPHSSRFFLRLLLFPHPHPAIISDEAKWISLRKLCLFSRRTRRSAQHLHRGEELLGSTRESGGPAVSQSQTSKPDPRILRTLPIYSYA